MLTKQIQVETIDGASVQITVRELCVGEVYDQPAKQTKVDFVRAACTAGAEHLARVPMSEVRRLEREIIQLTNGTEGSRGN